MKVFRLHTSNQVNVDWHETQKLSGAQIATISDPADSHHSVPVTSIPSPFGRVFLVRDAFERVCKQSEANPRALDGQSIHHHLVSETLDLAQLIFGMEGFRNGGERIEIRLWDKSIQLKKLENASPQHQLIARTMELFWKDAFAETERIYVIIHNNKPIGGTSPSTLFFTNPNDENFTLLQSGPDSLFDKTFCPLYRREAAFVRYLYLYFEAYPALKRQMPLFYSYLNINKTQIADPALRDEVSQYATLGEAAALVKLQSTYSVATLAGEGTDIQLLPNIPWYCAKSKVGGTSDSDFVLGTYQSPVGKNEKYKGGSLPLVLQNNFHKGLNYWGGAWQHTNTVPYENPSPLDKRTLPGLSVQYPYLTVSDLLEPYLLELPFKLDEKRFFNGNAQGFNMGNKASNESPDNSFLLPIKRLFFDYFGVEDLKATLPTGQRAFELRKISDQTVRATLRIPIQANNEYVTFERDYHRHNAPNLGQNLGAIAPANLNVGFFPFLNDDTVPDKRIVFVERDEQGATGFELRAYKASSPDPLIPAQETTRSDMRKGDFATSHYYSLDKSADYLTLAKNGQMGLLLPIYPRWVPGTGAITFAIDFGQTNSHIEYAAEGELPRGFDIEEEDIQLVSLDDSAWETTIRELRSYLFYELIPTKIGSGQEFSFPTRTALSEAQDFNPHKVLTYGDMNPAFWYEKYKMLPQYKVRTNLKWATDDAARPRTRGYIESLMLLMRNKVLLKRGDLSKTRVVWFSPSSMGAAELDHLEGVWQELHAKYFPGAPALVRYSESDAPYYHGAAKAHLGAHPAVNIDIGGGSTDVAVFVRDPRSGQPVPAFITSFRFAGSALFGVGYYNEPSLENAFVRRFQPKVDVFFQSNYYSLLPLIETFEQLKNPSQGNAADLMSFFFSLDNNLTIKQKNLSFNFTELVQQDSELKILVYLFYGAIQYHIASMLKSLGLGQPQNVFFSGNGSKILQLLDRTPQFTRLTKMSKTIYEKVYQARYHAEGITLHRYDEPKAATCKGGIAKQRAAITAEEPAILSLLGNKERIALRARGEFAAQPLDRMAYGALTPEQKTSIADEVRACFNTLLLDMDMEEHAEAFGIPIHKLEAYYKALDHDLMGFLETGFSQRLAGGGDRRPITDSPFFYPIIGALHRLGIQIANNQL